MADSKSPARYDLWPRTSHTRSMFCIMPYNLTQRNVAQRNATQRNACIMTENLATTVGVIMNSISFDGRLGKDSELRYVASGDAMLKFAVASDVGFGDKKQTNWFYCTMFGKRAEALAQHLIKGTSVTVYGVVSIRKHEEKSFVEVKVNEITLQGGSSQYQQQQSQPQTQSHQPQQPRQQQQAPASNAYGQASGSYQNRNHAPVDDFVDDIPF